MSPIGNSVNKFSGHFDGQGYLINGLSIVSPSDDYIGLFGSIDFGAVLTNFGVTNINIVGHNYVGGLAGNTNGSISKVLVTGSVQGTTNTTGGVVGLLGPAILSEIAFEGTLLGGSVIGGIAGNANGGVISNCYAKATITSNNGPGFVGGILGESNNSQLTKCYFSGGVSATNGISIGGGIGYVDNVTSMTDSFTDAQVVGSLGSQTSLFMGDLIGTPVRANLYFNANQSCSPSCSNSGSGMQPNATTGLSVISDYFYDKTNPPMSLSWDFTNIWQEHSDTYPTLRNAPSVY